MTHIKTYSVQVISFIKQRLLDGSLSPGDSLREKVIAEQLGISRGPVREALQVLLQEGLASGSPQKVKYIRRLDDSEIMDSYQLGGTLEGICVVQALSKWTTKRLDDLAHILAGMEKQCSQVQDLAPLGPIDDVFHDELLRPCDNRLMINVARNSCMHISKFLYHRCWISLFSPKEFLERHRNIYNAVATRDPVQIQAALLHHYEEIAVRLIDMRKRGPASS